MQCKENPKIFWKYINGKCNVKGWDGKGRRRKTIEGKGKERAGREEKEGEEGREEVKKGKGGGKWKGTGGDRRIRKDVG